MQRPSPTTSFEMTSPPAIGFVRMPKVREITGLGRSTIYRLIALDLFPGPVQLGPRAVGWRLADIDAWSVARQSTSH